jgi:hypothetical protein
MYMPMFMSMVVNMQSSILVILVKNSTGSLPSHRPVRAKASIASKLILPRLVVSVASALNWRRVLSGFLLYWY